MSSSLKRAASRGHAAASGERAAVPAPAAGSPAGVLIAAWLVPGAGHLLTGRFAKALVFFLVLTFMFVIGLAAGGRLFPLTMGDPLVLLAGLAEWGLGLPRLAGLLGGLGDGRVIAVSYEYGNTFLIAGGLLNILVVLDAFDLARGIRS
jgi:hypothetical protein